MAVVLIATPELGGFWPPSSFFNKKESGLDLTSAYKSAERRFLENVDIRGLSSCWIWKGGKNFYEYGQISVNGKTVGAHRWSYEHFVGPIPSDLVVMHFLNDRKEPICDRACVNPVHLKLGTNQENTSTSPKHRENVIRQGHRTGCRNFEPYRRENGLKNRKPENAHLPEGVSHNRTGFQASKSLNNRLYYLGTHRTPVKASEAYQKFCQLIAEDIKPESARLIVRAQNKQRS